MSQISQAERATQDRVIKLFQQELGYTYLGNWQDREDNLNIEEGLLSKWLSDRGQTKDLVNKVLTPLRTAAGDQTQNLYYPNKEFYSLIRYGVTVQPETGKNKMSIPVIDWETPENNDFFVAEEVTIHSKYHSKRPDIVLYVNGIALGVIELKRSSISVSEGIRQNLDNQKHLFIKPFYNTMQLVMAGNDFEGLAYGTIETPENYYLRWKEVDPERNQNDTYLLEITRSIREKAQGHPYKLDRNIIELLNKERFLELIYNFVVFDSGTKKLCRHNQYYGVKAAQKYIRDKEGGIIWHTQGSGKSLTMVWLTKWIREYNPNARVLVITDREELDDQIEKVYKGVDEDIYRTKSGRDFMEKLNDGSPWLMCSLVHKFGGKEEVTDSDIDEFIAQLKSSVPPDFKAKGDFYVFVDECHRTQSGKLHRAMKEFLPEALFIGFTGTPLLKQDKQTSLEVFGPYIHTYKFDEAVADEVVLDLRYEARDIEQKITSPDKIDEWFELKTRGLTDLAKSELKQKWGTIKTIYSSRSRLEKIVMDIMMDMERKDRLMSGHGNAMLVSDSIYNACRYFELFQNAGLKKCAIVTSFVPTYADIKGEETGQGNTDKLQQYEIYRRMLGEYFDKDPEQAMQQVEQFEQEVKKKFVEEPGQMRLLIVVNKLLTGFDAPPATFLYIDRKLRDHGLFQAVCRVNRLHGDDKDYGYIVDYMDLFSSLESAFKDFTSEAFGNYDKTDIEGLLKDRHESGKKKLEEALEAIRILCEPVEPPGRDIDYVHYFCGDDTQDPDKLKDTEPRRVQLYKLTSKLIRAFANIVDDMLDIGYSEQEIIQTRREIQDFEQLRQMIQIASGEFIDLKEYEPTMRHLIDSYIGADDSRILADLSEFSLVDLLVKKGKEGAEDLPEHIRKNKDAMAEAIENNLRKVIIEESPANPIYYEKMSVLLDELIQRRREEMMEYEKYLEKIIQLCEQVRKPHESTSYPESIDTTGKQAFYDNLGENEQLAIDLEEAIMRSRKDGWKDHPIKTRGVTYAIKEVLKKHEVGDVGEEYVTNLAKQQSVY